MHEEVQCKANKDLQCKSTKTVEKNNDNHDSKPKTLVPKI